MPTPADERAVLTLVFAGAALCHDQNTEEQLDVAHRAATALCHALPDGTAGTRGPTNHWFVEALQQPSLQL
eukprot:4822895-Prymnesium_polylepis.1